MKTELESLVSQIHRGGIRFSEAVDEFRKAFIIVALRENRGNISKAAPQIGLHRNSLTRIISELQLDVRSLRPKRGSVRSSLSQVERDRWPR